MRSCRSLIVLALLLVCHTVSAQEWTRFRGPNGTGVSEATTIPVKWSDADFNWKVEIPGVGHSSPVVWGDKIFLLSADPTTATRHVLCYSAKDGQRLWQKDFASEPHHLHTRSSFASSTPAVDAEHAYFAWSTPKETTLKAFDHNGSEVWTKNLGTWQSQHGYGTSPIVYGDLLIVHNSQDAKDLQPGDQPGESIMFAFDRRTGKEVWKTPLVSVNVCYSVPFIYQPAGGGPDELVCISTGNGVFSLDPKTGQKNWAFENVFEMRTVCSPILAGGLIFGSTGSGAYSGNYIAAVKPGKQPELAYQLKNSSSFKAPYVPCLLAKGDSVFCLYDKGFAACIDAPTGNVNWLERTDAAFSGSPVLVRDKIYCVAEDGVVWVMAADEKQYRLLAQNPLGEECRSTPAISGGKMYLRTVSHLFSIGGKTAVAAR